MVIFVKKVRILQKLKPGILDPEGSQINMTLERMGYPITDFHIGREMTMEINVDTDEEALKIANDACQKILINPIIHDYEIEVVQDIIDTIWCKDDTL